MLQNMIFIDIKNIYYRMLLNRIFVDIEIFILENFIVEYFL